MNSKRETFTKFLKIIFVLLMICLAYSFVEPFLIEEKTTVFHDGDIPQNFVGKKIVFASDFHMDPYFSRERLAGVVKEINALHPDVIVLGGDYVTDEAKYLAPCFEELGKLKAPMGVYGVSGNHDNFASYSATVKYMKEAGIIPLENDSRWLDIGGERIKLGGVATDESKLGSNIKPTIQDANVSDFVILVSHTPDLAENLQTDKIDLMLSGHTHGGQVTLFGLWALYVPSKYGLKYLTGIVKTDKTTVLISNGIGTSFLPMRFFARPQINTIDLEK